VTVSQTLLVLMALTVLSSASQIYIVGCYWDFSDAFLQLDKENAQDKVGIIKLRRQNYQYIANLCKNSWRELFLSLLC
jgi:hypothetical protein